MPESSAITTSPVAAWAARALISALASKLSPSSGGISNPAGSGRSSTAGSSSSISASLWRLPVARINATRSCTSRRRAMPPSARASSSSSEARESGVRSAVACTSTRPPSPVMTTLASTSALESSM